MSYPQPETLQPISDVTNRELTNGEKLVGLTFNPSGDPRVRTAKTLCASLADLIYLSNRADGASDLYRQLYDHTIGEILNAQMNVVKLLTFKY